MIIYNSTWSILIQWIMVMIVRSQSDLVNTIESVLLFVINLITRTKNVQKGEEN